MDLATLFKSRKKDFFPLKNKTLLAPPEQI